MMMSNKYLEKIASLAAIGKLMSPARTAAKSAVRGLINAPKALTNPIGASNAILGAAAKPNFPVAGVPLGKGHEALNSASNILKRRARESARPASIMPNRI
jgi:hypothetical protein